MLLALHAILAGLAVFLGQEGLKVYAWFDRQSALVKQVTPFVLAFLAIAFVRGGTFPHSGLGWAWYLGEVVIIGVLAGGWYRARKAFAPQDVSQTTTPR